MTEPGRSRNGTVSVRRRCGEGAVGILRGPRRFCAVREAGSPISRLELPGAGLGRQTQGQLAWYRAMEEAGEMVHIADAARAGKPFPALGRRR